MEVSKKAIWKVSLVLATGLLGTSFGFGQAAEPNVTPQKPPMENPASRADIFLGYSYYSPYGSIQNSGVVSEGVVRYGAANYGAIGQGSYWLNRYVGLQVEYANHSQGRNDGFQNFLGGVAFRFPWDDITPFIHGLAGGVRVGGPNLTNDYFVEPYTFGANLEAGGGIDYDLPYFRDRFFKSRLSLRVFQADYQYIHVDFGPHYYNILGGRANLDAVQLSTGLVMKFGSILPPPPITYACSISPGTAFPGDPITITGTATNVDPKKTALYTWSSNGPKITGTTATATIDTTGSAPGTYTVTGHVSEGSKAGQMADCTASFTVRNYEPPTISCSANPSTVAPGQDSTITSTGMSPQNRPLTYSYSATAGSISGSTSTTTLSTTGAAPGPITVTCNVMDDKSQSASATTTVTVEAPAMPVVPKTQKLCSISFGRDKKRPARVDNEAKACLDEVALSLQQQSSASAVVVGESGSDEKMGEKLAKERAVNTKAYLTTEKGVDGGRIEVRTGPAGTAQAENYLVPSGATFTADVTGTMTFDAMPAKPMKERKHHPMHKHPHKVIAIHTAPQ